MLSAIFQIMVGMVRLFIGFIKLVVTVVLGSMVLDWFSSKRTRKNVNQYWTGRGRLQGLFLFILKEEILMIKHTRIMPRVTGDKVTIEAEGNKNTIISGKDWALVLPKDMPIQQVIDELTEKQSIVFLDNWKGDKGVPRLKEEREQ